MTPGAPRTRCAEIEGCGTPPAHVTQRPSAPGAPPTPAGSRRARRARSWPRSKPRPSDRTDRQPPGDCLRHVRCWIQHQAAAPRQSHHLSGSVASHRPARSRRHTGQDEAAQRCVRSGLDVSSRRLRSRCPAWTLPRWSGSGLSLPVTRWCGETLQGSSPEIEKSRKHLGRTCLRDFGSGTALDHRTSVVELSSATTPSSPASTQ